LIGIKKASALSSRPKRVKVIMAYFSHELFKGYFEQFELNTEYLYSKIVQREGEYFERKMVKIDKQFFMI
jgi:hypothetical protein